MISQILSRFSTRVRRLTSGIGYRLPLVLLFAGLAVSCDIIEPPYTEKPLDNDTAVAAQRKVVLFDFTGHTCKSCPKAHRSIDQMLEIYGGRLIPIAFHLGYFAKPLSGDFSTDFRTPEGAALENYFNFVAFPTGTVQNLRSDGLQTYSSWPATVAEELEVKTPLKITVVPEFVPGTLTLSAEIYIKADEAATGPLKYAVYLLEDGIVDWQKDEDADPMDVPDYVHNHVFRTSFSGVWGESVGDGNGLEKGVTFQSERTIVLDSAWNPDHCHIVSFVYRDDTKEIIQAESVPIK
jgi:hypothetical protein